ncbi:glycosyltransferase [Marinobacter maritimus]|uniref:glycosyltransferase n=1 Tax=Marinobacter maritimus TaxID=277961 RepID=UPI0011A46177|nr:glycosyltransferase [Marinobacter maritimus]
MLFINGALGLGGLETFYVRMAKERAKQGLPTSLLLLSKPEASDENLLEEMKKYAKVVFTQDIFSISAGFSRRFPLLSPVKKNALSNLFENVNQIHVSDGMLGLVGERFNRISGKNIPITIGFYHYIQYLWGGEKVPSFEKTNRRFVFKFLPKEALLMFSDGVKDLYEKNKSMNLEGAQVFRLGVVDKKKVRVSGSLKRPLKIIAIGRLVDFKTYNLYMLEVVSELKTKGIFVKLDIFGDGPLKQHIITKINQLELNDSVALKGSLEYSKFDETVSHYDLFVGSGTAIIQAASLGLPSIIGVENVIHSKTYGYFSDFYKYEYNLKGLSFPLLSVEKIIENYFFMDEGKRLELKKSHIIASEVFTNEACQKGMDALKNIRMPVQGFKYNRWSYELSRLIDRVNLRLNKNHPRLRKFEDFRKLHE